MYSEPSIFFGFFRSSLVGRILSRRRAELESLQQKQASMKVELAQRRKNIVELQQKKQRVLKAQIRRAQARITNAERKRRTHRLVLIGTYIEHTTKDDQAKRDQLMKGLDAFLERDHDRAVFNLQPKETAK